MKKIRAVILTIGDEILNGDTIDSNSAFIGKELNLLGVHVHQIISIGDTEKDIIEGLKQAQKKADIVLITGGLGPTNDDVTKHAIATFFNVGLKRDAHHLAKLNAFYTSRKRAFQPEHMAMADLPENATVLENTKGTAAGMLFFEQEKLYVSMPGVPYEMKEMFMQEVVPRIPTYFLLPTIKHRYFLTAGRGETQLASYIKEVEDYLPAHLKIAYLPSLGTVKIRLTGRHADNQQLNADLIDYGDKIAQLIEPHLFGDELEAHTTAIGKLLRAKNLMLATAESCTGGNIAHKITSYAGSSAYFNGGAVVYSNALKSSILGVNKETLLKHGAVSEPTVKEMVKGSLRHLNADVAIATTGISGPTGGSAHKPVGTIWIAVGNNEEIVAKKFIFALDRQKHIEFSSVMALEMLRRFLLGTLKKN